MRGYQLLIFLLLLSLLCSDVYAASRPSQRRINPKKTTPTPDTVQDPVARLDTKVAVDTQTGAWNHNMKHVNKTRLWVSQPSIAQAIGVNMVGTVVVPVDLTVLPVGYQGEGHLGLNIPPSIWRHWASGISGSRPEKIHHGQKTPIYNSISGGNSLISESDRIRDEGFYADIIYDVHIGILPFIHQITDTIMFVYKTLHRTELGLANLLREKEISPHVFVEPVILTRLLQVLYENANELIHGYTLTIMNPKRDWIIESFAMHGLLDDVLEGILTSAHANGDKAGDAASQMHGDRQPMKHYPPFYGFRNGLSYEEIRRASELRVQEWSEQVLRLVSDESSRIDQRIDYESQHLRDGKTDDIPWNSMSLFDYLDEKILLYAEHGYNSEIARQQSLLYKATESNAWLHRLEESLQGIIQQEKDAALPSITQDGEIPINNPATSTTTDRDALENGSNKGNGQGKKNHLDPFGRRIRPRGGRRHAFDDIMTRRGNAAQIPEIRRSQKDQIKLVSSIITSDQQKNADLSKTLDNQNQRSGGRSGYHATNEHDRKFRTLALDWSKRVTAIFETFSRGLMQLDKIYDNVTIEGQDGKQTNMNIDNEWFQGIDSQVFISILSHLFPTQLALQSYQSYHESSPLYRQTCLTEVFVGRNRSAILDVNAGSFSWGGKGNIGMFGTPNPYTARYGYKQGNNLPNADVLGLKPIKNREQSELIMHYYDVDGIRGMKLELDHLSSSKNKKQSQSNGGDDDDSDSIDHQQTNQQQDATAGKGGSDATNQDYDYSEYDPNYKKNQQRIENYRKKKQQRQQQQDGDDTLNPIDRQALRYNDSETIIDTDYDDNNDEESIDLLSDLNIDDSDDNSDDDDEYFLHLLQDTSDDDNDDDEMDNNNDTLQTTPLDRQTHQRAAKAKAKPSAAKKPATKKGSALPANSARLPRRRHTADQAPEANATAPDQANQQNSREQPKPSRRATANLDIDSIDDTVLAEHARTQTAPSPRQQRQASPTVEKKPTLSRVKESSLFQEALDNLINKGEWVENRPSVLNRLNNEYGGARDTSHQGTTTDNNGNSSTQSSSQTNDDINAILEDTMSAHDRQAILDRIKHADELADIASKVGIQANSKLRPEDQQSLEEKIRKQLEMDQSAVADVMKNIEKSAAQKREERATLGDDSITEDLTLSGQKMRDNIRKRQEILKNRRTGGFSPIDGHRRPGSAQPSSSDDDDHNNNNNNDIHQQEQQQNNNVDAEPKKKQSLDKIESEILMLSQLLTSDMCVKGYLDCATFEKELSSLQRVYDREVLSKTPSSKGSAGTSSDNDDDMLNAERSKKGQQQHGDGDDNDLLKKEIEVDLTILDGKRPTIRKPYIRKDKSSSDSTDKDENDTATRSTRQTTNTIHYDQDDTTQDEVDISLSTTSDAAQGLDNLSSPERLNAILNAMPEGERSKINFGDIDHNLNNKKLNMAGIDYYMSHLSSAISAHIDTNILPPMELSGIDKLYYRRVHFTFYVLTDHTDYEPLDVFNVPEIEQVSGKYVFRNDDLKDFYPYQNPERDEMLKKQEKKYEDNKKQHAHRKTRASAIYHDTDTKNDQYTNENMNAIKTINANLFHLYQLAIEQVRIRGQQFTYNIITIPISSEPSLALALQSALMSSIAPSVHSNASQPHHHGHHYLQSNILAKALVSKLDTLSMPLPRNTRHIPVFLLSLASPQPLLIDVHHQAVVTHGIVIGIQTPHSPGTIAQIEHNLGNTYSSLIPSLSPHAMKCNGHKLYIDPRDPLTPMFYSTLSLLFSSNPPSPSLWAIPQPPVLALSLSRTQIDAYHRNYLLTSIRTATKVANKATYTLTLEAATLANSCVLDATYSTLDSTRRNPFIKEWDGKKIYKLARKAHRSVRYHLHQMRDHMTMLEFEAGVKYIRTLIGTAWQYHYLSELLLSHADRCSYKSSLDKNKIDLLSWETYADSGNDVAGEPGEDTTTDRRGSRRPPDTDVSENLRSSYTVQKEPRRRGVGIYVWLIVIAILVGLIVFRSVNDIAISVEKKND